MPNVAMPEGIDTPDLECVMLDVEPQPIRTIYGLDVNEDDFFYGPASEKKLQYAQGPVAETVAHLTLMFGIHPSDSYVNNVLLTLEDWDPGDIFIEDVGYFPSSLEGYDYNVIVAKVKQTSSLMIARKRLETLPYTDKFKTYNPHITLAYIKGSADKDAWVRRMSAYFKSTVLTPVGLNLGLDD